MKIQDFKESFWRSVKFFLLFILMFSVLYIVLTKLIIKIPITDNNKLLASITDFEKVIEQEKKTAESAKLLMEEVKLLDFNINQEQKLYDIEQSTLKIASIYKSNNRQSKYKFSLQTSRILDIYIFTKKQNSNLKNNMELLTKNLTECQANL